MTEYKEPTKTKKYHRKMNINIGLPLFGVILFYVIVNILIFTRYKQPSYYEVQHGVISKDISGSGIVIRTEKVIPAEDDGYVNFYRSEGTKVAADQDVCAVSDKKLDLKTRKKKAEFSDIEKNYFLTSVQNFSDHYNKDTFSEVYRLQDEAEKICHDYTEQNQAADIKAALEETDPDIYKNYVSQQDGILIYGTDGYEGLQPEDVTDSILNKSDYVKKKVPENKKIKKGEDAYKLITQEEWSMVLKIDTQTAESLKDRSSVHVRFMKDDTEATAKLQLEERKKNKWYAYLTFESGMVRYAEERYLDIEIELENVEGLKIPKSAVVKKDCYKIPREYIVEIGEKGKKGVLVFDGKDTKSQPVTIYEDTDENTVCISTEDLPKGTMIKMKDSNNTRTLSDSIKQTGVYEAGNGYAVFTSVNIVAKNKDYYIVKEENDNKLSNYDRIVADAESVKENEILVQ